MRLYVPAHTVTTYTRDDGPIESDPGDLVLVRHHGIAASGIRFAERLRKPRGVTRDEWNAYCRVNHAAIALEGGCVAQATARGIVVTRIGEMGAYALAVVHVDAAASQRAAQVAFAHDSIGTGYGFAQIPADFVNALTGLELAFGWGDRMVCSTGAGRDLERTDYIPDRTPSCLTPAHLAWHFGVVVPAV